MFGYISSDYDRLVYENRLAEFLPDRIIDVHTHIWRKDLTPDENNKSCVAWTKLVAEDNSIEDIMKSYEDMFPGKKVTPVLMGQPCAVDLDGTNRYTSECAAKLSLPALYCTSYNMSAEKVEKDVIEGGFAGLKPYCNNCPPYIPDSEIRIFDFLTKEHLELADRHGWIVMLHIPRPGRLKDPVNITQLMEIEEKYPNIKLIVAHIGRAYVEQDIGDAFETLKNTKNMMFDFTANTLDVAMVKCVEAVGPDRFMFGSDLPVTKMRMYRREYDGKYVNIVPKGLYGDISDDPHMLEALPGEDITNFLYEELIAFRRCAVTLGLSKEDVSNILFGNAAKLFGIK